MQSSLATTVKEVAAQAGFDLCGVTSYPFPDVEHFDRWIAEGNHGDMAYLAKRNERGELRRRNLAAALPWARSVVVCAINYNPDAPYSTDLGDKSRGWISRYALAQCDYHDVLFAKLRSTEGELHLRFGDFDSRSYVDTGPIVERTLAQAAGIGWIGKNTCLINERERLGSWLFLGCIVTSLDVREPDITLPAPDRCGTCTRCIDACPTTAITAPYQLDARRCIAYLTIEKRGTIEEELRPGIGNNVFGCDICQDVCPWNRRAPITSDPDFTAEPTLIAPDLERLAALSTEEWRTLFRGSPVKRTKYQGFLRNVCVAMGNSGDPKFLPRLRELAEHNDVVIAEHARFAIAQVTGELLPAS